MRSDISERGSSSALRAHATTSTCLRPVKREPNRREADCRLQTRSDCKLISLKALDLTQRAVPHESTSVMGICTAHSLGLPGDSCHAPSATARPSRRDLILHSFSWPLALGAMISNADPTTLLNSVLGAYFLPRLPDSQGFKLLDDFDNAFTVEFPRSWVGRPNSMRSGLNISDYNTSDKLTVEILPAPPAVAADPEELTRLIVTSTVIPGFKQGQADDKLALPSSRLIKRLPNKSLDGQTYLYLEFPSETITRSGYNIRRLNFAVAAIKRDSLYVCSASARSDQFNKEKELLLRHIIDSFKL